jgi:hypothetical protein
MSRLLVIAMLIGLMPLTLPAQTAKRDTGDAKELSGMSVLGNNDTPKALVIVPWKSSEIGLAADLTAGLLDDAMAPVDKEVFLRRLQFYEISAGRTETH